MTKSVKRIVRISLPSSKPPSVPDNNLKYHPDGWEFDYASFDYLVSLTDAELLNRYNSLLRNMTSLTSPDRNYYPIESFLSSWYWFRKEHQTRYEMEQRELLIPVMISGVPMALPSNHSFHLKPARPNSCEFLYRYCEPHHADQLLKKGSLYLKCASEMELHDKSKSRYDNEIHKSKFLSSKHVSVLLDGKPTPIKGRIERKTSFPDYYLYCVSTDYDPNLLNEFGGACVVIKDPKAFAKRIENWGKVNLPEWMFENLPVKYFDPFEEIKGQVFTPTLSKSIGYAYQREFRFLFSHLSGLNAKPIPPLELGSIEDIAEIVTP